MKKVEIYTDGACSGNPGKGGWACILLYNQFTKELSGTVPNTTNNRMEMQAVIEGLKALKESCEVVIFSDSALIVNAFNDNWIDNWQKNGWKTRKKTDVENQDLWQDILVLVAKHKVTFVKVKGHSDNVFNNRCDKMAVEASQRGDK